MIPSPTDRRSPLVKYETLRAEHQQKIQAKFGNPYEYMAKEPIRKMVKPDFKAEDHFRSYRFDNDKSLSYEHQKKYSIAASWLNMCIEITNNKKAFKEIGINRAEFWIHVCDLIKTQEVDLPTSYQRLINKIDEYKEKGYDLSLIHI